MNKKNIVIKVLIYLLLFFIIGNVFYKHLSLQVYFIPIVSYLTLYLIEKKYNSNFNYSYILSILIVILTSSMEGGRMISSMYINLASYLLSFIIYYFSIIQKKTNIKYLCIYFASILMLYSFNYFYREEIDQYHIYGSQKNYRQKRLKINTLEVINNKNEKVKLDFQDSTIIYFWSTSCPVCIKKLPLIDKKVEGLKNIKIYSILVHENRVLKNEKSYFDSLNFKNLRTYYLPEKKQIMDLNVDVYPTSVLIVNGNIIFKGDIKQLINL